MGRRYAALALSLSMLAAVSACGAGANSTKKTRDAPVVSVVDVDGAAAEGIRMAGVVGYKRETVLSFKVPGVISRIRVDVGDAVRPGQVLASLNLTEYAASASESTSALRMAEAQFVRTKTLFDKGLVAQARLDDAQLAVDRARAAQQSSSFNQAQGVIAAPSAGIILRRNAEPSQNIGAGQPVLMLGETASGLIIRGGVSSAEARRIHVGDAATVDLGNGATRAGKVRRIAAKSDSATGSFDVEIDVTPIDDLRSGQVAAATIKAAGAASGALRIPTLALLDARADQGVVYVVDATNTARRRNVQTAGIDGDSVIIVGGLKTGEKVISAGAAFVQDGQQVAVAPASGR